MPSCLEMEKFTSGDDALKRSPTQHDSFDESDDDDGFYVVGYDQGEKVDERNISETPPLPPDMQSTSFQPICPLTPSNITPKLASMSTLRPKSIQSHDRNVTPHTASLMSLFARPPITPLTPTTPNNFVGDDATSHDDNVNCTLKVFTGKIPNMPSMASQTPREVFSKHSQDIQQQQQVQQKDDEDISLIARTTSEELSYAGPKSYFRQNTPVTQNCARHNRDETLMAHNLTTDENESCIDDARILSSHDKFDCIRDNDENDEKTPMIDQPSNPVKSSMGLGGSAKKSDALLQSFQHKDESKNRLMNLPSNDYSTFSVTPDNNENSSPTYFVPIGEKDGLKTSKTANATCGIKINETKDEKNIMFRLKIHLRAMLSDFLHPQEIKTTLIGAFLFALYQLVFCFAQASAITRPSHPISSSNALLAPMACMACVGSLLTAPMLITGKSIDGTLEGIWLMHVSYLSPFLYISIIYCSIE